MSSPAIPHSDGQVSSDDDHALPTRQGPKLYASNDGSHSGTGTPMGFQRYPQNKHLEGALGDATSRPRYPSPQPTHLGIPGTSPHRVLSEEDPGYIAAKFEGKQVQMEQGERPLSVLWGKMGY